ncbi:MAG: cytochrome o ubiquinol oxidase subunit [Candidatus Saccharibacteria bacterium]|nr:cytochrome o ubiquinol oxidase subunit [Candidatus Saccharibacteria bacterium]
MKHGQTKSYVIGFILSLIFTLVPYYLVQHKVAVGRNLLVAILGLAVVQLIIQVVYFLHLGRKPTPRWEIGFLLSTISIILVVTAGSLVIIHNLHSNMSIPDQEKTLVNSEAIYQVNGKLTGACQMIRANHQVIIKNNTASPRYVSADKCDTLTFVNQDSQRHTITFGTHTTHSSYAGVSEFELRQGKPETITLSETGGFNYHDHQRPSIAGSFLVLYNGQGQ